MAERRLGKDRSHFPGEEPAAFHLSCVSPIPLNPVNSGQVHPSFLR